MATQRPDRVPTTSRLPATVDETLQAQQEGHQAALDAVPVGQCPHRLSGREDATEAERVRFLQLMWLRGYRHAHGVREDLRATPPADPTGVDS